MSQALTAMEWRPVVMPRFERSKMPKYVRPASFAAAFLIHAVVLWVGGAAFYKPAEYAVEAGVGSVEVDLVAGVPQPPEAAVIAPVEAPVPSEESPATAPAVTAPAARVGPQESIASTDNQGVQWTEPRYRLNRPPRYPREALAQGIEGETVLLADIDEQGRPIKVVLEKSSGNSSLDRAAIMAVERWVFNPAHIGSMPVRSRSRIPIHFTIES